MPRTGLVGEAAAFLDPFYSPGSDFIAIGNTMVGRLIEEDLDGKSIEHLAPTLQSIFLTLFQNNLITYRDVRLTGLAWLRGWASFTMACSIGAVANVGIANLLFVQETIWVLAGMAGTAFISGKVEDSEGSSYVVPAGSLFGDAGAGTNKVWVIDADSTARQREVTVGRVTPTGVQITAGLQSGERIATAGVHTLYEGQPVKITGAGE